MSRFREALEKIRDANPIDMALDPDWPRRVAKAALDNAMRDRLRRWRALNPPADADALARVEQSKPLITATPEDRDDTTWEA
jgi:hypothetical protein